MGRRNQKSGNRAYRKILLGMSSAICHNITGGEGEVVGQLDDWLTGLRVVVSERCGVVLSYIIRTCNFNSI